MIRSHVIKCSVLVAALAALLTGPALGKPGLFPGPSIVDVPAGEAVIGSDRAERETAYQLDERAYKHRITRKQRWYENERPRRRVFVPAFSIMRTPVTNRQYLEFVNATGHRAPDVDAQTWKGYRLIHPYSRTRRHAWRKGHPPTGRMDHPVVLVSHTDALAYAKWLSRSTGRTWRLPTELEWEKAARGTDGRMFPWGNRFDPRKLNSHDAGPFDTVPVGLHPGGASPFGVHNTAGQVFEWTSTPAKRDGHYIAKGGSWDDKGCGVCRPAQRQARPAHLKHILMGFRLVRE